jgi:hypothetical protein
MRVILVLVVALTVVSGSLFAGKDRGIRGGYIEGKLDKGSAGLFDKGYNSFYVGFFNDQKIIPMLYFYSGLDYYQTGSKTNDDNKLVLHYCSIPIALKLKIGPVMAFGGVHGAVKVSSRLTVLGESSPAKDFSTFDAGAFLGAGLHILFIGAEVKYTWGLVDIYNGYKNNFWQFGLTLGF